MIGMATNHSPLWDQAVAD